MFFFLCPSGSLVSECFCTARKYCTLYYLSFKPVIMFYVNWWQAYSFGIFKVKPDAHESQMLSYWSGEALASVKGWSVDDDQLAWH